MTEPLVKNVSNDAFKNILFYVLSRGKYGESEFLEASKRLGVSEDDLKQNSASFHASCRKTAASSEKLKRTQTRFEKAVASNDVAVLSHAAGRPSLESKSYFCTSPDATPDAPQRISRSFTAAAYNKEPSFFCQTHDEKRPVHAIQSENRGKQLYDFVKNCDNDLFKVYLSSAIKPDDALSIDVHYHRTCWTKHVVRAVEKKLHKVKQLSYEYLNLIRTYCHWTKVTRLIWTF